MTKKVFLRFVNLYSLYRSVLDGHKGPSIKDVGIFLAIFDTPLPHVGILTLIYLISTF